MDLFHSFCYPRPNPQGFPKCYNTTPAADSPPPCPCLLWILKTIPTCIPTSLHHCVPAPNSGSYPLFSHRPCLPDDQVGWQQIFSTLCFPRPSLPHRAVVEFIHKSGCCPGSCINKQDKTVLVHMQPCMSKCMILRKKSGLASRIIILVDFKVRHSCKIVNCPYFSLSYQEGNISVFISVFYFE